jgi:hypothetical protein
MNCVKPLPKLYSKHAFLVKIVFCVFAQVQVKLRRKKGIFRLWFRSNFYNVLTNFQESVNVPDIKTRFHDLNINFRNFSISNVVRD